MMAEISNSESEKLTKDWLKGCGGFINNQCLPKVEPSVQVCNPFSKEVCTNVSLPTPELLDAAVANCSEGHAKWKALTSEEKAAHLFNLASTVERHFDLFATMECITSGKTLNRIKTQDVANLVQNINYYANLCMLSGCHELNERLLASDTGVVCVIADEFNEPSLSVSWRIASILAAGNTVLLLVNVKTCLSAFLLAELFCLSNQPSGILNVLPFDGNTLENLPNVSKILFTGTYLRSKKVIEKSVLKGIPCKTLICHQPVAIVYETSDLFSAAEGVLELLFHADTRSERSGCKVYIQSSIHKRFLKIMEDKFNNISVGPNKTGADLTCLITEEKKKRLITKIKDAEKQNIKIVRGPEINIKDQLEPTLLCDVPITSQLLLEIDGGPIIITIPFRTVKESISMFNHDKLGCDVSIWTDKLSLALEVAPQLKTGTVWVNSQNLFDAAAAYGGASLGSNSIEGGIEAFYNHLNFRIPVSKKYSKEEAHQEIKSYGLDAPSGFKVKSDQSIKHSYEHHIGGSYKKPAGNSYLIIQDSNKKPYAYVANGSSSDMKDAVSNAVAAQPNWETVDKYKCSEIFRKTSNALKGKKEEFITQLHDLTGKEISKCTEEVDSTICHLITLSIYIATKEKESLDTKFSGQVFKDFLPVGVIGIQCPDQDPLLSFAYLVSTAVIYGNTVAVIPSENFPCLALKMCEIFRSSGIPSGVVNVVCGNRPHLTRHLCSNLNVSTLWFVEGHAFINHSRTVYPRRVFDCRDVWKSTYIKKCRAFMESTQIKVTYMPAGTIFAN